MDKPDITGSFTRYRVWTVNHIPYDHIPRYADGGAAIVVLDGWSTSTSSLNLGMSYGLDPATVDRRHTLHISQWDGSRQIGTHPLDGTRYDTREEADRAAYDAGLTGFFVKVADEAKYGLS